MEVGVVADLRYWSNVGDKVWDRIRSDYGLTSLDEVTARLESLYSDPAPVLRRLLRVFIGDGTFFPGFQFRDDGTPDERVLDLFEKALALKVPHNVFAAWMVNLPCLPASRGRWMPWTTTDA